MKKRVYISGPITIGDKCVNFYQGCNAQVRLMNAGLAPFNPMLSMMLPGQEEIPHAVWMGADLPWVAVADAVLRLSGDSVGGDEEVKYAEDNGIPVFYSVEDVIAWYDKEAMYGW